MQLLTTFNESNHFLIYNTFHTFYDGLILIINRKLIMEYYVCTYIYIDNT